MTPSNNNNGNPLILRILDSLGIAHQVAPVQHTHSQSEVDGLETALNAKANTADVNTSLAGKQNTLTFDSTPTANSTNPVTSGGVKAALDNLRNFVHRLFFENPTDHAKAVVNVATDENGEESAIYLYLKTSGGGEYEQYITKDNFVNLVRALANPSTTPENTNNKLITSGGVKAALDGKANTIHTHAASQVEGVVPYYWTYDGSSIDLDTILSVPNTMQRLIIDNDHGSQLVISDGLFTSQTEQLEIYINTPGQFIVGPLGYAMVTIFKVDRGGTSHGDVCYFVHVEGIFDYHEEP